MVTTGRICDMEYALTEQTVDLDTRAATCSKCGFVEYIPESEVRDLLAD